LGVTVTDLSITLRELAVRSAHAQWAEAESAGSSFPPLAHSLHRVTVA